ncbi:hypothetical protein B0T10DRAFT_588421 [Thelonectria olida]|uniref:F-box domain-containing protein n=1 Tax=Thelonectria olida TaxID=1576542 RepID=A0A9P9AL29_9HYPO|nr:hypothetical protein B0T10DRAFT_588421 [Thelonectria olida]
MIPTQSQRQANSSRSRLSLELLRLIFAYFCPHCRGHLESPHWAEPRELQTACQQDARTLFNLCLVSQQFRDAAQEIMYHEFNPCHVRDQSLSPSSNPWERRLEPFLQTIASRPDLARSVKGAFLRAPLLESLDFSHSRHAFEQCAHALGTSAFNLWKQREHGPQAGISINYYRTNRAFLVGGLKPDRIRPDVCVSIVASELLTMLVALLPNLHHLKVEEEAEDRWRFDISRETVNSLRLARLPLKTLETDRPLNWLLNLVPDLETLVIHHTGAFWRDLPSLKTLRLMDGGTINLLAIHRSLSECTGHLSSFSYRGASEDEWDIVQLLDQESFRSTLETISLDLRVRMSPGHTPYMKPMPSFKAFTRLETLFLTTYSIYDRSSASLDDQSLVGILPLSITFLTLVDHDRPTPPERLREGLLGLANAKPTLFMQLKEIRCDSKEACDDYLRDMFERVGVDFRYQEFPRSGWSYHREPLPVAVMCGSPPSPAP